MTIDTKCETTIREEGGGHSFHISDRDHYEGGALTVPENITVYRQHDSAIGYTIDRSYLVIPVHQIPEFIEALKRVTEQAYTVWRHKA